KCVALSVARNVAAIRSSTVHRVPRLRQPANCSFPFRAGSESKPPVPPDPGKRSAAPKPMQQLQRDPRLFQETRSANGGERTIRPDQQALLAPDRPRRTLHSARKVAIRDKGSGCLRAEAPSAATSASPYIL